MQHRKITTLTLVLAAALATMPDTAAADTATINGKVVFDNGAPKMKRIKMDADPYCADSHFDEPARSQEVVVNDNGTLKNVFVYIKGGLEGKSYTPPAEAVELHQEGCIYKPRVFGMMAKQKLVIHNDDDTLHNVHALPKNSKEFNIGQPNQGMKTTRTFATPEIMVKFKCDVHPWMAAYVGVLDHPFHSVSSDEGAFEIANLPAGDYELAAWHEKLGEQTQKITVADGGTASVEFTFKAE